MLKLILMARISGINVVLSAIFSSFTAKTPVLIQICLMLFKNTGILMFLIGLRFLARSACALRKRWHATHHTCLAATAKPSERKAGSSGIGGGAERREGLGEPLRSGMVRMRVLGGAGRRAI